MAGIDWARLRSFSGDGLLALERQMLEAVDREREERRRAIEEKKAKKRRKKKRRKR